MRFAYLVLYWKLEAFFGATFDDGFQDWKAGIVMAVLSMLLIVVMSLLVAVYSGTAWIFANRSLAVSISLATAVGNWLVVGSEDSRRALKQEYNRWPAQRHAYAAILTVLMLISVVALTAWALSVGKAHGLINPKG